MDAKESAAPSKISRRKVKASQPDYGRHTISSSRALVGVMLSIKIDTRAATKSLSDIAKKQLPFAISRATTALARGSVTALKTEMQSKLDRPTPFTLNAFYAKPGMRRDPTAYVASREFAGKGRPAWKYLQFQSLGGSRDPKGVELKLRQLSGGQFIVPTPHTPLDRNGNIQRGWMTQVLSRLSVAGDASVGAKTVKRLRKQRRTVAVTGNTSEYFVGHLGGQKTGIPIGIFKLVSKGVVQKVLAFTPRPPMYRSKFNVETTVQRFVEKNAQAEFRKALDQALATAR